MRRVLGGVAAGAVLAGAANLLLFGSLFASGPAESRLLFLAAVCIGVALCVVGFAAFRRPSDERLADAARQRVSSPVTGTSSRASLV